MMSYFRQAPLATNPCWRFVLLSCQIFKIMEKNNNYIQEWNRSNSMAYRSGKIVVFQKQKLSFCKKLSHWIRWGKYVIRIDDVLWFAGYDESESTDFKEKGIDFFKEILQKYIGEKPYDDVAKEAEKYSYRRWLYAKFNNLSKAEMDDVTDVQIDEYVKKSQKEAQAKYLVYFTKDFPVE